MSKSTLFQGKNDLNLTRLKYKEWPIIKCLAEKEMDGDKVKKQGS
jgi:hypothetical protein